MPSDGMKYAVANVIPGYGMRIAMPPICALLKLDMLSGSSLSYLLNMNSSFHAKIFSINKLKFETNLYSTYGETPYLKVYLNCNNINN